jgi:DNA-binding transcriptional ArsR family regulator
MSTSTQDKELFIHSHNLNKSAQVLRAIRNKLRHEILHLIHEEGRLTVTEIFTKLKLTQSVASGHLSILKEARIVHTERYGKYIYYSINYHRLRQIHLHIEDII